MDIKELHEKILYPVVRVRTEKAGGSGSVIACLPDPENDGEHQTFVLTNWHVVEAAISTTKEWNSVMQKDIKVEVLKQVQVELFDYARLSEVTGGNARRANIVGYDKNQDLAVLLLDDPKPWPYVAKVIDRDAVRDVKLFTEVWASGCSLGHDPFANPGRITFLKEDIENKLYWMLNANSIFGNSGGPVFHAETGDIVGVTARVSVIQLGFGFDVQTWMNFCIPPQRLYEFFDEQCLEFLYDGEHTYKDAMKRREKKQQQALLALRREDED